MQRGKGKHVSRTDYWPGRATGRAVRGSWGQPGPRSLPVRGVRGVGSHLPPVGVKRPGGLRDRRPVNAMPARGRPLAPVARSYDRGPPGMYTFYTDVEFGIQLQVADVCFLYSCFLFKE